MNERGPLPYQWGKIRAITLLRTARKDMDLLTAKQFVEAFENREQMANSAPEFLIAISIVTRLRDQGYTNAQIIAALGLES